MVYKNKSLDELRTGGSYKSVVCEVTGYRLKFNKNVFDYYVDGVKYKHFYHNTERLYQGEKYFGKYKPLDPNLIIIDLTYPIIDTLEYNKTICTILDIDSTLNKNYVEYEYIVDGEIFNRVVYVKNASSFIKGEKCSIVYNIKQPEISYPNYRNP